MNKRLRKKQYKDVLKAKELLDSEELFDTIQKAYLNQRTSKSRLSIAVRRVVTAGGGIIHCWRDAWQFNLPSTAEAMRTKPSYVLTLHDPIDDDDHVLSFNVRKMITTGKSYYDEVVKTYRDELIFNRFCSDFG